MTERNGSADSATGRVLPPFEELILYAGCCSISSFPSLLFSIVPLACVLFEEELG